MLMNEHICVGMTGTAEVMRKELDDLLCQRYPLIFSERNMSMKETCMCWGFSCGDGWFDRNPRQAPSFRAGKESADAAGVLCGRPMSQAVRILAK
jgi:hypothetical protein